MLNNIIDYIKAAIDEKAWINKYENNNVPIYLKEEFDFYKGKILEKDVIFIEPKGGHIALPTLEKRIEKIKENTGNNIGNNIIVLYDSLSDFQRKKLIEKRIAFIVSNKQMYVPFIAFDLNYYSKRKKDKKINKFSTSAQVAYLYLLYNNIDISINGLSRVLKRTKMTASRVLDELYNVKLVNYIKSGKTGRKKYYRRIGDPHYFKIGYQYLKSPILEKVNIYEHVNIAGTFKAGLNALAEKSMINKPKYEIRAMVKANIGPSPGSLIDNNEKFDKEPIMQIEVWAYDPGILSRTGSVDIVSLQLSLADEKDERVQIEMDGLMREHEWYMD